MSSVLHEIRPTHARGVAGSCRTLTVSNRELGALIGFWALPLTESCILLRYTLRSSPEVEHSSAPHLNPLPSRPSLTTF